MALTQSTMRSLRNVVTAAVVLALIWIAVWIICLILLPEVHFFVALGGAVCILFVLCIAVIIMFLFDASLAVAIQAMALERGTVAALSANGSGGAGGDPDAELRALAHDTERTHTHRPRRYASLALILMAIVVFVLALMLMIQMVVTFFFACTPWPDSVLWVSIVAIIFFALCALLALYLLAVTVPPLFASMSRRRTLDVDEDMDDESLALSSRAQNHLHYYDTRPVQQIGSNTHHHRASGPHSGKNVGFHKH